MSSGASEIVARRRTWHQTASSDAANPTAGFSLWIETAFRLRARRTGVHSICQSGMTSVAACRRQAKPRCRVAMRPRPPSCGPHSSGSVEQQRIAFASASVRCAGCFGFRHIFCVDGDDTRAAPMSGHHHSQRLVLAHAEFRLQNRDDELAGREVIIDYESSSLILKASRADCLNSDGSLNPHPNPMAYRAR